MKNRFGIQVEIEAPKAIGDLLDGVMKEIAREVEKEIAERNKRRAFKGLPPVVNPFRRGVHRSRPPQGSSKGWAS